MLLVHLSTTSSIRISTLSPDPSYHLFLLTVEEEETHPLQFPLLFTLALTPTFTSSPIPKLVRLPWDQSSEVMVFPIKKWFRQSSPQKVVIGISVKDQKARAKAFKIAVSLSGVDSACIQDEKGQLEVVGEVDAVALANQLRKRLGQAELVSVGSAEKKEEKKDETPKPQSVTFTYDPNNSYHHAIPYPVVQDEPGQCSVM
nr:heavy metal-associated isoprenylated plant protein 39-like isoform X1 [Ipomoea trifida]